MKNLLKILLMVLIVALVYTNKETISDTISDKITPTKTYDVLSYNSYYQENNYLFVQNTDKTSVSNYQELLNMFYTILDSGDDDFYFYCEYDECLNDVNKLTSSDSETLGAINNFVHPYNSYSSINIDVNEAGRISVKVKHVFSEEEQEYITTYINNFIMLNVTLNMTTRDKIKAFHDYIINNTKYDEAHSESNSAYTLITTGTSICNGYSEIMSIYLYMIGVKNYRIASENHIWNLANVDNTWYHIDTTWDDPIASDGNQYLLDTFFLIDYNKLKELDQIEHNFDELIYLEAK